MYHQLIASTIGGNFGTNNLSWLLNHVKPLYWVYIHIIHHVYLNDSLTSNLDSVLYLYATESRAYHKTLINYSYGSLKIFLFCLPKLTPNSRITQGVYPGITIHTQFPVACHPVQFLNFSFGWLLLTNLFC